MQEETTPGRPKTRDRVLAVALDLFNTRGAGRVTTAEIAEAAGINEGNLYYYFQRKAQLIEALFDAFAEAAVRVAEQPVADPSPAAFAVYGQAWFALMWEWRVFYRDGAELFSLAPDLPPRLRVMTRRTQAAVKSVLEGAAAAGVLALPPDALDPLIRNLWIVSTYWMAYFRVEFGRDPERDDLLWGWRQVEMLYRPYLPPLPPG